MADDPTKDGTDAKIVSFRPRSDGPVAPPPLPPLPPAPQPSVLADAPARDTLVAAAFLSEGLPRAATMGPPLALMMPPPPALPDTKAGDPAGDEDDEGEFAPLAPADPDNPTAQETLQTCMTLVTALGVAAAKGMWHRARHRQALADQARADADKAKAKAAAGHQGGGNGGHGGGRGGSKGGGGGLLTGSRQEGGSRRRPGGFRTGGHDGPGRSGRSDRDRRRKRDKDAHGDGPRRDRKGPKAPKPPKAPKAAPDGRKTPDAGPAVSKPRKRSKAKGGLGDEPCVQTRERRKGADAKDGKDKAKDKAKGKTKDKGDTTRPPKSPKMTWTAPRKSKPGPGADKALPAGRKRWKRPAPTAPIGKPDSKRRKDRKKRGGGKHRPQWMRWRLRWSGSPAWAKRWRARRAAASSATPNGSTGSTGATDAPSSAAGAPHGGGRESWTRTPPPPPRGTEWMRPPPGADRSTRITVERVDERPRPRPESAPAAVAGAPATGRPALTPAAASSTTTSSTTTTAATEFRRTAAPSVSDESPTVQATASQATGGQMNRPAIPAGAVPAPRPATVAAAVAAMPAHGTQYDDDAELTIRDVIEAAQDAAEEITEGVEAARATADGAERMASRLEALHAEIVDLKVPGWLEAIWGRLVDKALHVKACAEGLAETLPAASEAITVAAGNAAARDLGVADTTRDYGHIRPAEREYHDE